MDNKNNIDREMLLRYLKGDLTPADAWKVEKAMLDDPFLAEAMEGLEVASHDGNLSDDLEEIERRIKARDAKPAVLSGTVYLRVAAVIVILAVSAFVIFSWMHRNAKPESEIAMQKPATRTDTSNTAVFDDSGNAKSGEKDRSSLPASKKITGKKTNALTPPVDQDTVSPARENPEAFTAREDISGNSTPVEAQPVSPPASSDSSNGYSGIVEAEPGMKEQTSLASGAANKAKRAFQPAEISKAEDMKSDDEMIYLRSSKTRPLPGDSAYADYIMTHLKYPAEARKAKLEGPVYVQFTVRPDSTLRNVVVIKGIGGGCDEEALRLIKEGPKWVPAFNNGKPVTSEEIYKINFSIK